MLKWWMWMRSPRESVARTVGGGLSLGGHWSLRTEWRDSRLGERRGILNVRNHKPGNVLEVKESKCQGRRDKFTRKSCWTERQKKSIDRHSLLRAIGKSHVVFRERSSHRHQSAGVWEVKGSWRGERERSFYVMWMSPQLKKKVLQVPKRIESQNIGGKVDIEPKKGKDGF